VQAKEDAVAYKLTKNKARNVISTAKREEGKRMGEFLDKENDKGKVFRAVKRMVRRNKDVIGGGCVKDKEGNIVVKDGKIKEIWKDHFEKLSNEEFNWDRNSLSTVNAVNGPAAEEITCEEVKFTIGKMKSEKAAGPSGVVAELLWLAGVVREGKIPED
jgi:hypothetical protein